MVTSWSRQWNDSRWPQLFAISSIRCFGNVSKLVTKSRVAKLARRNVALLPALTIGVAFIQPEQSVIRWRLSFTILFANESFLLTNEHDLQSNESALLADKSKLQSDVAAIQSKLILQSFESILLTDKSQVSSHKSRLQCFVQPNESLLVDFTIIQPNQSCLFSDFSKLQPIVAELQQLGSIASVPIDDSKLLSIGKNKRKTFGFDDA
jgi:hypothetical protein